MSAALELPGHARGRGESDRRGGHRRPPGHVRRPDRPLYAVDFDHVERYEAIVEILRRDLGQLPDLGWKQPDGNRPTHLYKAEYGPLQPDFFTLAGVPVAVETPWEDPTGAAVQAERCASAAIRRYTNTNLPVAADEDLFALQVTRADQDNNWGCGTYSPIAASGWMFYQSTRAAPRGFFRADGTAGVDFFGAAPMHGWNVQMIIGQRGGNLHLIFNRSVLSSALAMTAGICTGQGFGLNGPSGLGGAGGSSVTFGIVLVYYRPGIAATLLANTYELPKKLDRMLSGIEPKQGAGLGAPTFSRASVAMWTDRNGRDHFASSGLPRAGDKRSGGESGLRIATARVNQCYRSTNPADVTALAWTGAVAPTVVDDSAELATHKRETWGPNVYEYANTTGATQYIRTGATTGDVAARSLQVLARVTAGAGTVKLGLYDESAGTFAGSAIHDGFDDWTQIHGQVPGDTDCTTCLEVPAGVTVRWIGHDRQTGARCTTPIPNWLTAATASRAAETLTLPITPADGQGAIECGITPMGWGAAEATGQLYVVSRAGAIGYLVYSRSSGRWGCYDGATVVQEAAATQADGVRQVIRSSWGPRQQLAVDGTIVSGTYDGTLAGAGALVLTALDGGASVQAEVSIDSLRVFRGFR